MVGFAQRASVAIQGIRSPFAKRSAALSQSTEAITA